MRHTIRLAKNRNMEIPLCNVDIAKDKDYTDRIENTVQSYLTDAGKSHH